MSMTGLGAGSHQQTVVALLVSGGDAAVFLMGALFKSHGAWSVLVGALGRGWPRISGWASHWFGSSQHHGRDVERLPLLLLLNDELCPVGCWFLGLNGTGCGLNWAGRRPLVF